MSIDQNKRRKNPQITQLTIEQVNEKFRDYEARISQLEGIGADADMHGRRIANLGDAEQARDAINRGVLITTIDETLDSAIQPITSALLSTFLVLNETDDLTNERYWRNGHGIESVDGGAGKAFTPSVKEEELDHNRLDNLAVGDVHTQYLLLAGRSANQVVTVPNAALIPLTLKTINSQVGDSQQWQRSDSLTVAVMDYLGNLGLGLSVDPEERVHARTSAGRAVVRLDSYVDSTTSASGFKGYKARGTYAAPTKVTAGSELVKLTGSGYYETAAPGWAEDKAGIKLLAEEDFTSSAQGTYITLETTPIGSATKREIARFSAAGYLGVGVTPTDHLHVLGSARLASSATGVVPLTVKAFGTPTANIFEAQKSNGDIYVVIDPIGNLGIHADPEEVIHALKSASSATMRLDTYSDTLTGPSTFAGYKARGTYGVPTAVLANTELSRLSGSGGYLAAGVLTWLEHKAQVSLWAEEEFTASAAGTYVKIETTPIGSVTRREVARFTADATLDMSGPIDFNTYQAIAMVCHKGTTFPTGPAAGQWFYRTDISTLFLSQTVWKPIISFAAVTLYVDPTGTNDPDHGYTSGTGACLTIQYAINRIPPINGGNVIVNIAAGTYSEDVILQGKSCSGNYSITINGTLTAVASGTIDSGVMGVDGTQGSITDTGNLDAGYANKLLCVVLDGTTYYRIIDSCDADTATIAGTFYNKVPDADDTYTIYSWGAKIEPPAPPQNSLTIKNQVMQVKIFDMDIDKIYTTSNNNVEMTRCSTQYLYCIEQSTLSIMQCLVSGSTTSLLVDIWKHSAFSATYTKMYSGYVGGWNVRSSLLSTVNIANGCIIDGNSVSTYGFIADSNSIGSLYSTGTSGFNQIRNHATGLYANSGAQISGATVLHCEFTNNSVADVDSEPTLFAYAG